MNQEQDLSTEPDASEHNGRRTLLSPWMQRRFEQLSARSQSLTSAGRPLTLSGRSSRAMGATLTHPRIGALTPGLVEHFGRSIAARAQTVRLVAIRRPIAATNASTWNSDIKLILPGGLTTGTGQVIERFSTNSPGTFTVGQPIEPFHSTPSRPTRSTHPASTKPISQPARPTAKKQLPAQARLYTRVEEIAPQSEMSISAPQTAAPLFTETHLTADQATRSQPGAAPASVIPQTVPLTTQRTPEPTEPTTTETSILQPSEPAPQAGFRPDPSRIPGIVQRPTELSHPSIAQPAIQRQASPDTASPIHRLMRQEIAQPAIQPQANPVPRHTPSKTTPEQPTEIVERIVAAPSSAQRETAPEPSQPTLNAAVTPNITPTQVAVQPAAPEIPPVTSPSMTPPIAKPSPSHEPTARFPRAVVEPIHPLQLRPPRALPVESPALPSNQRSTDSIHWTMPENLSKPPVIPQASRPSTLTLGTQSLTAAPGTEDLAPPVDIRRAPEQPTAQRQAPVVSQHPTTVQTRPSVEIQLPSSATTLAASHQPIMPPIVAQTAPAISSQEDTQTSPLHITTSPTATETVEQETVLPFYQTIQRRADTRSHGLVHAPALTPTLRPISARVSHQASHVRAQDPVQMQKPTQKWEPAIDKMPMLPISSTSLPMQRPYLTVATSPTLYTRSPNLYIGPGRPPTVSQKRSVSQAKHYGRKDERPHDLQTAMQTFLHRETPLILPATPQPMPAITATGPSTPAPRGATTAPERTDYSSFMPLTHRQERQQATTAPKQTSHPPAQTGEVVMQPAITGQLIQREPAMQSIETENVASESIDLATLARRVYPLIKHLIAVERERARNF